jgi:hypothetical protein
VIGDFIIQTDEDAEKNGQLFVLLKHTFLIGFIGYILVGIIVAWQIAVVIIVSHAVIDYIKARSHQTNLKVFVYDQFAHLSIIIVLSYFATSCKFFSEPCIWVEYFGRAHYSSQVFIFLLVLAYSRY